MAFTAPITRATDFLVTAAVWNAEHVDNMNTAWPHLVVRKTSDQSVTSSTALVDDTALQLTVAANEVWRMQYVLRIEGSGIGDFKNSWTFPASGRITAGATADNPSGSPFTKQWDITTGDASPGTWGTNGAGVVYTLVIEGTYVGAGSAGTVILRWAQNTSDATATKVLTNSTLWAVKLA